MASLHKEKTPTGEAWRLRFTDESGRRKSIWIGQIARKIAETIKSRVEEIVVAKRARVLIRPETASWLGRIDNDLHQKLAVTGIVKGRNTEAIAAFIDHYLDRLDRGESTLANLRSSADNLYVFFGRDRRPETISQRDAEDYKEYLAKAGRVDGGGGYGKNSCWKKLQYANRFFQEMVEAKLIVENPFRRVSQSRFCPTNVKFLFSAGCESLRS